MRQLLFKLTILIGLVPTVPVSAAQPAEDQAPDYTPTVVGEKDPDAVHPGQELYEAACSACHEGSVHKAPHKQMLGLMTPEAIVRSLESGVMADQGSTITAIERALIAEYLSSRKLGAKAAQPPSCEGDAAVFDSQKPPRGHGWGFDLRNTRAIKPEVAQFNEADLGRLKIKWVFAFPGANRVRSQPAAAGGSLFVGSHSGAVYALDQETGCVRWAYQAGAEVRTGIVVEPWVSDGAEVQPMIFFGDVLGNVYAVNAVNGTLVWRHRSDDHPHATITAAPTYYDGKLYVSFSSLEVVPATDPKYECCKSRGSVVAYQAVSGEVLWQSFSITEEPVVQGQNPSGTDQYGPSGAAIWNSPTIDSKRNQLYVGTGENMSSPATKTSDAILAIDLESGDLNWVFQGTQGDAWNVACEQEPKDNCPKENGPDFDFGASPILVQTKDGSDLVVAGQKSGAVHALDPDDGSVVWQNKVGRGGVQGGIHFGMAAHRGIVYVPISDLDDGRTYPEQARPGLYALAADSGEIIWKSPYPDVCNGRDFCHPGISAAITATDDLVFAGGMDGVLRVHRATDGKVAAFFDTARDFKTLSGEKGYGGSIGGGAAPVVADGMIYVSSGYGIYLHMPGNVLIAFGTK